MQDRRRQIPHQPAVQQLGEHGFPQEEENWAGSREVARGYSPEERPEKDLLDTGWWGKTEHQATAQDIPKAITARSY